MTGNRTSDEAVRLGFTGLGARGQLLLELCLEMDAVEVPAVCDVQDSNLAESNEAIVESGRPAAEEFNGHEQMLASAEVDGVVIAPSWRFHIPMAVQTMEAGAVPGLDVGPANSVEECWELVRTAEETGIHCMMLENGCYSGRRLAVLEMVREGLFGELVHCETGYCHDLRGRLNSLSGTSREETAFDVSGGRYFRGVQHEKRNADLYPTHGVGLLAKCLDINTGNRFVRLQSMASKAAGLADWAERNLDPDHPSRDLDWAHGDIIKTSIKCANGETVSLTHDVSLPRPDNSKRFLIRGTRGMWHGDVDAVHVDGRSPDHEWEPFGEYREEFEHPMWKEYAEGGVHERGHGGSDYLVLKEYVESIRRDERPPIDVYDTAAWKAIAPLSEQSISRGGQPVDFPDFTNGNWMVEEPRFGLSETY